MVVRPRTNNSEVVNRSTEGRRYSHLRGDDSLSKSRGVNPVFTYKVPASPVMSGMSRRRGINLVVGPS